MESFNHPYTVFCTLTYNDDNLPVAFHGNGTVVILKTGEVIEDKTPMFGNFAILDFSDVQKFIKRFRNHFKKLGYETNSFRYYVAGEYGPTTFRPHYHGLFYFDYKNLAEYFMQNLSKIWELGFCNCSYDEGKSAEYTSKYVNCVVNLPKVYESPAFAPKAIFSKCPPLGTLDFTPEKVSDILYSSSVEFSLYSERNNGLKPLWKTLENSYFPRVKGYLKMDYASRVRLYGLFEEFNRLPWNRFEERIHCLEKVSLLEILDYYGYLTLDSNNEYGSLKRLYFISQRCCYFCSDVGISISNFVRFLDKFYSVKSLKTLKNFYEFQERYTFEKPLLAIELLNLYPTFIEDLFSHTSENVPKWYDLVLESFGTGVSELYDPLTCEFNTRWLDNMLNVYSLTSYKDLVARFYERLRKEVRIKKKNSFYNNDLT